VHESRLLLELLLVLGFAALGVALFERLRLPSIVGFLAIGALVGPGGLGIVPDPGRVQSLAELGVVFLLFEIGLELPLERVRKLWQRALTAGGLQVAITLVCVTGVTHALGVPLATALVMGMLVAMSSTALVMGALSERGEIGAPHGQLSVGILLFQDLCIVPFLLAVPLLAASGAGDSQPLLLAGGRAVLALVAFYFAARLGLPRLLDRASRSSSRELFTLLAFLVVVGSAVAAELLGLTLAVGAFIGGLALSASPFSHHLFAEVVPLRGVLLGLFFTAVGMLVDLRTASWDAIALYVGSVVLLKAAVVVLVVGFLLRQGPRLGLLTGLALAQTGEFSFVLAAVAAQAGLLAPALEQTFVAGSVLTLAATPFLLQAGGWIAARLSGMVPAADVEEVPTHLADHVVLVGFGFAGSSIARVLRARGTPYLAVEANPTTVSKARARGEPIVYGDAARPRLVERLGLPRARLAVVSISDPIAIREFAQIARRLAPRLPIVARTRYVLEVDGVESAGASSVVAEEVESTLALLAETLRRLGVTESAIAGFSASMREEGYELLRAPAGLILDPWLSEQLEASATEWVEVPDIFGPEATLASLEVRAKTGVNVLAVERRGETTPNPPASFRVCPGDRLLAFGSSEAVARLRELLGRHASAPG
jgi:CPA2 family monovalent cation:H+ antiporter-2